MHTQRERENKEELDREGEREIRSHNSSGRSIEPTDEGMSVRVEEIGVDAKSAQCAI